MKLRKVRRRRLNGQPTKRITADVLVETYQRLTASSRSLGWEIDRLAKKDEERK